MLQKDHRLVRDILLDLISSLHRKNVVKSLELVICLDKMGGPHFRFEEESLYPVLKKFFGEEYYEHLLVAHDRIIKSAKTLSEVLGKGEISRQEADDLVDLIRNDILPHPIECDGLAMMAERLNKKEIKKLKASFIVALEANVPLLEWAYSIRKRKT